MLFAVEYTDMEDASTFSGRISSLNDTAQLMRIKINFKNLKYVNQNDRIEFWNETYPERRCIGYVKARTNDYLMLKIPNYQTCIKKVFVTTGTYLHMYSPDLEKNLNIGKELVGVLLKKEMALTSKKLRYQKELDIYVEKMDAVNKRYEVLRQKLELEWQRELASLEEDKTKSFMNYKNTEARLNEVHHKMEKYRIQDQNLYEDRWSLDPKLYYKK